MHRVTAGLLVVVALAFAQSAAAAPLDPLTSVGCWSADTQCGAGRQSSLVQPAQGALAISPDGKTVYTDLPAGAGGITWLSRDTASGVLTPSGCLAKLTGAMGCTAVGGEMTFPNEMVFSPDGKNLYATTPGELLQLGRDANTGALTYQACYNSAGSNGCTAAAGTTGANDVAVSPDGENVYTSSSTSPGALAALARDTTNGNLAGQACFEEGSTAGGCASVSGVGNASRVAVSPDGNNVYVTGTNSPALATFTRAATSPHALAFASCLGAEIGCASNTSPALNMPLGIAVTPDGTSVYVADDHEGVMHFQRSALGALTYEDCWSDPIDHTCATNIAKDPEEPQAIAATNDRLYVAGYGHGTVSAFSRSAVDGTLTPLGCIGDATQHTDQCDSGDELPGLYQLRNVALTNDGLGLYTASGSSGAPALGAVAGWQNPSAGGGGGGGGGGTGGGGGGGGTTPGGGGGSTPTTVLAPVISGSRIVAGKLNLTLDRAASLKLTIFSLLPGKRFGKRCVAPTAKLRKAKKCTRMKGLRSLTVAGAAGLNKVALGLKKAGSYHIVVVATADGLSSKPQTFSYTIKPKKKR